ncbi:MAG: heme exporter protein CcmD [Alphaproteobacteria bacterium]
MTKISEFLDMGGYAGFVWPSYGAVIAVLAVLLWLSLRGLKAAERELAQLEGDAPRARRAPPTDDGAARP